MNDKSSVNYFEQSGVWDLLYEENKAEAERLRATADVLPQNADSLLDVGCGSGRFLALIKESHAYERLCGVEPSSAAASKVEVECTQASIVDLPYANEEFDVLSCLEVLEHIQPAQFSKAISELSRVARSTIIVTVPNRETLLQSLVRCPQCYCCFSPWHHVRSFSPENLSGLIPGFTLELCKEVGPVSLKRIASPALRGIHLFGTNVPLPPFSLCPQCGFSADSTGDQSKEASDQTSDWVRYFARKARWALTRSIKRKKWLLARFVRSDVAGSY